MLLEQSLFREMQSRVGSLARIGAELVDREALRGLLGSLSPGLSDDQVQAVEESPGFRAVSDGLNAVRASEERLVHYIYLFAPTADPGTALFVVDADAFADRQGQARGEEPSGDISHFGSVFDVSGFPVARRAIADRAARVEEAYSRTRSSA